MSSLKSVHDVRRLRDLQTRTLPVTESIVYLQLHRLASEKRRLEQEVTMLDSKKQSCQKRLGEIEHEMESLQNSCPPRHGSKWPESRSGNNDNQIVVEY